ncbi:MAG TPA: tripartite tricarboxylate transporter substrate-binding protein [Xanthobacteraceae bacterium]|nr:tripartite tricarboxylate transporter substrate-binding protein [Xanthobacteraceae bacterium]
MSTGSSPRSRTRSPERATRALTRRDALVAFGAAVGALVARGACAQDYPAKPIRMIVPYAAGGATDTLARLVANRIDRELQQAVIVDNRGGGASQVGTQAIAASMPDGYTIGMIDTAFTINPGLFGKLPYDTVADFAAISLVATTPLVLVVHPSVAATSAQELVALARRKPGSIAVALPGLGTPVHLALEQLRQIAGLELIAVPYRGAGPSIADFIAGQVQMTFATIPSILDHVRSGRARALAIVGARATLLGDVPTVAEAGFPGIDATPMFGLVAPAAVPAAALGRLSAAVATAVQADPLRARLIDLGFVPVGSAPEAFRERIQSDITKYARIIEAGNIKPN